MKTLLKFKSLTTILIIAFFAGCAGITEANLADDASLDSADTAVINQEVPGLFNGGDQEDIIDVKPGDSYENR